MRAVVFAVILILLPVMSAERYIVEFHDNGGQALSKMNLDTGHKSLEYKHTFRGRVMDASPEEARKLGLDPHVKSVRKDRRIHAITDDSLPLISADDAWKLNDSQGRNLTGHDMTIAVIDTGINYSHPDLGGCSWQEFRTGNCAKVIDGYDFTNLDNNPMDDNSHGTHCAGIASGNGTVKGVAPDARLIAYKVLDSEGSGYESDLVLAIDHAMDPDRDGNTSDHYDVISLSIGGLGDPDDLMSRAVDRATKAGVVVAVAAGNSGPTGDDECINGTDGSSYSICSPGTARTAITVGASSKSDAIAGYSSRGPLYTGGIKPDILAPGSSIYSTLPNGYGYKSGTSMATPHVAGAAALMVQMHPGWSPRDIKMAFRNTAIDIEEGPLTQGFGRFDVLDSIQSSKPPYAFLNHSGLNFTESFSIQGSATATGFSNYTVWKGPGTDPSGWTLINSSYKQQSYGALTTIKDISSGMHTIRLDVHGNGTSSSDWRLVNIIDNQGPELTATDRTIEAGDTFHYDVNATDNFAVVNYSVNHSSFSISPSGIITNTTRLDFKDYSLSIACHDPTGNPAQADITLFQTDTTAPMIEPHSRDFTIEYDESFRYSINATDNSRQVTFAVEGIGFTINQSGYIENLTSLGLGSHRINITVNDSSKNQNTTWMSVTVVEYEAPRFWDVYEKTVEYGSDLAYSLNITDNIMVDNARVNDSAFTISTNLTLTNASRLALKDSDINLTANDTQGNENSTTISIRVRDTTPPAMSGPGQLTFYDNQQVHASFSADDLSGLDAWNVNDTRMQINSSGFLTNATSLPISLYTLNISVNDTFGNTASSILSVNVTDNPDQEAPRFNTPSSIASRYQDALSYSMDVTDNSGEFTLRENSTLFTISQTTLENSSPLELANYTLEINATDLSGNSNTTSIVIMVQDLESPRIHTDESITISYGTGLDHCFNMTDDTGVDEMSATGNFTFSQGCLTNTTALEIKTYNMTISATDIHDNTNSTPFSVIVEADPTISLNTPQDTVTSADVTFSFIVTGTDNISYCTLSVDEEDMTNISSVPGEVSSTSISLSNGDYNWSVSCLTPYGSEVSETSFFTMDYTRITSTGSSGGGSSGGGSSGAAIYSPGTYTKTWYRVTDSEWYSWNTTHDTMTGIRVLAAGNEYNARVSMKDLDNVSVEAEDAIHYFNISADFPVEKAEFRFRLKKDETLDSQIMLARYTTRWVNLKTSLIQEGIGYNTYEAVSPGTSLFAIKAVPEKQEEAKTTTVTDEVDEENAPKDEEPERIEQKQEIPEEPVIEEPSTAREIPILMIVLVILAVALTLLIIIRKPWKMRL